MTENTVLVRPTWWKNNRDTLAFVLCLARRKRNTQTTKQNRKKCVCVFI